MLLEDGLLFSGDHILNGSTTVVDPPDGDMTAYLDSLDRLSAACAEHGIEFILPAHGHVLGFAPQAIAQPEGAPPAARSQGDRRHARATRTARLDDWVPLAYDDVPPPCGRWRSARCWRTWSASAPCSWPERTGPDPSASAGRAPLARNNVQREHPSSMDPASPVHA